MVELAPVVIALAATAATLRLSGTLRERFALLAALPAVALGALSLGTFGLLFTGVELGPVTVALAFAGILGYLVVVTRRYRATASNPQITAEPTRFSLAMHPATLLPLLGGASLLMWAGRRWVAAWPHGSADAVNIWTSRALLLARTTDNLPARFASMLQEHPDYPLLLPTTVAAQYGASGSESLLIPQATSALWLVAVVVTTFALTARLSNATVGALAAAAVATNPLLSRWGFVQCADVPMAYLLLLFTGAMAIALTRGDDTLYPPHLIGFFAGLLMWTKTEGTVLGALLIALAATYALLVGDDRAAFLRRARYFALGIVPPLTALVLFRTVWIRGVETPSFLRADWLERLTDLERWRVLVTTAAYEATFYSRMRSSAALVLAATLVVLVILIRRRGDVPVAARLLLVPIAVAIPVYLIAYMLSPYDLPWHVSTSVDRLLLQLMPTLIVGTALALAAADGRLDSTEQPGQEPS